MSRSNREPLVVGVIQARLGSSRLPGKVLAELGDRPMLEQIARRVGAAQRVGEVVIATTDEPSDDELAEHCSKAGIAVVRGPTDDLARRVLLAAELVDADIAVRVWGDCPFIDTALIEHGLSRFIAGDFQYATTTPVGARTYPAGVDFELYRVGFLRHVADEPDPFFREFPFEYVAANAADVRWLRLENDEDQSEIDLTVDYPQDLQLARELYARLDDQFSLSDVLGLLAELDQRDDLPRNAEYLSKKEQRTQ